MTLCRVVGNPEKFRTTSLVVLHFFTFDLLKNCKNLEIWGSHPKARQIGTFIANHMISNQLGAFDKLKSGWDRRLERTHQKVWMFNLTENSSKRMKIQLKFDQNSCLDLLVYFLKSVDLKSCDSRWKCWLAYHTHTYLDSQLETNRMIF